MKLHELIGENQQTSFEVLEAEVVLQCWIRPIPYNPQPLWWYMQKPWGAEESGPEGN